MSLESVPPLVVAVALASSIALLAWRAGSLSGSGAMAAIAVGTAALHTAWGWGLYLVLWFVSASALSRMGRSRKARRTAGIVGKGDRRDGWQVLANGCVFALGALGVQLLRSADASASLSSPLPSIMSLALAAGAAAALAAAGADTWATEVGTLVGGEPWSLRLRRRVTPGTSGAVTVAGSLAAVTGGALLALLAWWCGLVPRGAVPAVWLGAMAGSWTDTVLGAWWQLRRHCPRCDRQTEQDVHDCGTPTHQAGGVGVLDNDGVNLLCTIIGAAVAAAIVAGLAPGSAAGAMGH